MLLFCLHNLLGTGQSIKRRQVNSWQDGDYKHYCQMLSHSSADMHNRDLVKKVILIVLSTKFYVLNPKLFCDIWPFFTGAFNTNSVNITFSDYFSQACFKIVNFIRKMFIQFHGNSKNIYLSCQHIEKSF